MAREFRSRKSPRMKYFDYSSSSYYFITICAYQHRCLFGTVTQTTENGEMQLNDCGEIVDRHIRMLDKRYPSVTVHQYVIMPNHIHMILILDNGCTDTVTKIIGLFKSGVSREAGSSVWQRSFYDHVIRNEEDYRMIWQYIDNNPAKWAMDQYYYQGGSRPSPTEVCERESHDQI